VLRLTLVGGRSWQPADDGLRWGMIVDDRPAPAAYTVERPGLGGRRRIGEKLEAKTISHIRAGSQGGADTLPGLLVRAWCADKYRHDDSDGLQPQPGQPNQLPTSNSRPYCMYNEQR